MTPFTGCIAGDELNANPRFCMLRTIIRPERKNGRSGGVPQTNAVGFRMIVQSLAEFVSQLLIEYCFLGRKEGVKRLARRLCNRALH